MRTIVVGVDGSEEAQNALRWAMREAALRDCRVHAVLAYDIPVFANPLAGLAGPAVPLDLLEQQARGTLEAAVGAVTGATGDDVQQGRAAPAMSHEVVTGHAGVALVEASKRAELLVVGKQGRSGLLHRHLGSVSSYCVHNAHCPVIVVPLFEQSSSDRDS